MLAFLQDKVLTSSSLKLSRPSRVLNFIASLCERLESERPTAIKAEAALVLRDLITQCMYGGALAHESMRSDALRACSVLLRRLHGSWSVEAVGDKRRGTLAMLLCSVLRGELQLLFETQLTREASVQQVEASLEPVAALLSAVLEQMLGAGEEAAGEWATLPADALLHIQTATQGAFKDYSAFLIDAQPASPLHRLAVAALSPHMCDWALGDDLVLGLLASRAALLLR